MRVVVPIKQVPKSQALRWNQRLARWSQKLSQHVPYTLMNEHPVQLSMTQFIEFRQLKIDGSWHAGV